MLCPVTPKGKSKPVVNNFHEYRIFFTICIYHFFSHLSAMVKLFLKKYTDMLRKARSLAHVKCSMKTRGARGEGKYMDIIIKN